MLEKGKNRVKKWVFFPLWSSLAGTTFVFYTLFKLYECS